MSASRHARVGRWLCVAGALLGALGLLGWLLGLGVLTTYVPGEPPMMPNTALALLLLGGAGALRHREDAGGVPRTLSLLAAVTVVAIGVGTLAEYLLETAPVIDRILIESRAGPYAGRPSPPTALALACLGGALLLFDVRPHARARPSEWLVIAGGLIALAALTGFLLGAGPLYRLSRAPVIGVAVPTGVSLLLTSAGLLLERPRAGLMRLATSPGQGGMLLRRLVIPSILVPVLLGLALERFAAAAGIQERTVAIALLASSTTLVILFLLAVTAVPLNRMHDALERSRLRTKALVDQAPDGIFVADLEGRYTDVNDAGCGMLGYARDEIVGKRIVDLLPPEEVERLHHSREQMLQGASHSAEWRLRRKDGSLLLVEVNARILADGRWQGFVRDITDRKRTEQELREARERFELALRGADLAAWDWNIQSGQVTFNSRWAEMRGFRPEEIEGHVNTWISGVHPEDLPRLQKVLDDYLHGRRSDYEAEHRVRTKAGHWIWILDRGKVFARNERGEPIRMVGTELDITSRKRADEALRLAEAKASGIVSLSADAIISIDEQQRITLFNEGAEKTFGHSRAEVLGAPLDILIPERFRAAHREHVARFAAGPEVSRRAGHRGTAICGLRKNGEEFPVDAAISKLEVAGTRVLTVVLRDITEQKRIEHEQRFLAEIGPVLATTLDYEETLSKIALIAVRELAELCIVDLVDDDGREVRRLRVVSRDSSDGWICDQLQQIPAARPRRDFLGRALETQQAILVERFSSEELAALLPSDEHAPPPRAVELQSGMAIPLLAQGKLLGVIALLSATPQRAYGAGDLRVARELAQRAALAVENARLYRAAQRAVQVRDDVLGVVAHDLRNPLASILLQVQLLRRGAPDPERKSAERIERAATRMNRLIEDLLDVARMEAGRLSIQPCRVSSGQVISDVVELEKPLLSSRSLELRLELSRELPDLWADRDRLLQVFENLVGNALKFTPAGGRVCIGAAPRGAEVLFWVRDTGPGIPAEDQPCIFDWFWQARRGGRRGAGLGLPIVKGIVQAHGGSVWVESPPGQGSSFFFTLPAARPVEGWRPEPVPRPSRAYRHV